MKIYGDKRSGNCYKLQLVCALTNTPYQWQDIDILQGQTRTDEFLTKNPWGKIPLLELDDGRKLSESNAIVNFIAQGSELLPDDPWMLAQVQQWQFFEQYSHEPCIAVCRFIQLYLGMSAHRLQEYDEKFQAGLRALAYLEQQLQQHNFLVDNRLTTADISLFAYTHVAHEGGFDLQHYPAILAWIHRIQEQPGFVAMESGG